VKLLETLDQKLKFVRRKEIRGSQAAQEAQVPLDRLRAKASDNVRKWILHRVQEFRDGTKDKLSIQNLMMRCRFLFHFLKENAPDVQEATRNSYVDVTSRIILDTYKATTKKILKQMAQISTAQETIVPATSRSFMKSRRPTGESTLFFSLGERARLLSDILAPPTVFTGDSYPIEALLRSLYQCLIDDVTSEHAFAAEFFEDDNIAIAIFAPVTKFLEQFLDELLARITDPVCVVLLLRFAYAQKAEMERRRVFKIDQHLVAVQRKLAARFQVIIGMNQQAIETADARRLTGSEPTAHHANAMTRRFAEFATSLSVLSSEDITDVLDPNLHMIAAAVVDLLDRTSREFPTPELGVVFLINNYYLILSTLSTINGCVLIRLFDLKLQDCIGQYVDLVLHSVYKKLVETVRRAFTKLETREEPHPIGIGESELKEIALDFKATHLEKMKQISESQIMKFGDFMNGRSILSVIAKRLVLYWTKFEQLCRSVVKNGPTPQWFSNLISTQQLVCNIRPVADLPF
jgi:hypothetical protein